MAIQQQIQKMNCVTDKYPVMSLTLKLMFTSLAISFQGQIRIVPYGIVLIRVQSDVTELNILSNMVWFLTN